MIQIVEEIYKTLEQYQDYLFREGLTSKERTKQKVEQILQAIYKNLGGIITHRTSPYKELGKNERCLLYVYRDPKSKTQWGFAYKRFDENVIVYYMKNLKLITDIAKSTINKSLS